MNRRHRKTLDAIFADPIRRNIRYSDVVSLVSGLHGTVDESREGSRVAFTVNGITLNMHKPHPQPTLRGYQVRDLREFLQ